MKNERLESASRLDVHNIDSDITACLTTLEKELSTENWNLVQKYNILLTNKANSKAARRKELRLLLSLNRFNQNKSWESITKDDVSNLVYEIMTKYSRDGQETWTSYNHKRELKMFLRWVKLGSRKFKEVQDPIETKSIEIKTPKETLAREDLISDTDRTNMLAATTDLQSKALIDISDESACRAAELLTLKIRHVSFDQYGAIIKVDGKTGSRPVRLIRSSKNLLNWYNNHPFKDKRDSPLFIAKRKNSFGKQLSYSSAMNIIKDAAKNAKIDKRITFTIERHSGATKAANMLTEAQMKKRHGWTKNSPMPARYVHLINSDVENAMLDHYGLKKEEEKPEIKKCVFCQTINSGDVVRCETCDKPLDLQTAIELEEKENTKHAEMEQTMKKMQSELEETKQKQKGTAEEILKIYKKVSDGTLKGLGNNRFQMELTPDEVKEMIRNGDLEIESSKGERIIELLEKLKTEAKYH